MLLAFALWQRTRPSGSTAGYEPPGAPAQVTGAGNVAGWQKSIERSGVRVALRLEPLHPTDTRQEFDAEVLRERLRGATPTGEPWRLTLSAPTQSGERGELIVESLEDVRVEGMQPLVHPSESPPRALVRATGDPLATLFALPAEPLHAGEECDLVFWGPAPGPNATVVVTGIGEAITLSAAPRSGSRESLSIATLDPNPTLDQNHEGESR